MKKHQLMVSGTGDEVLLRLSKYSAAHSPLGKNSAQGFVLPLRTQKTWNSRYRVFRVHGTVAKADSHVVISYEIHPRIFVDQIICLIFLVLGVRALCTGNGNWGFVLLAGLLNLGIGITIFWQRNVCIKRFEKLVQGQGNCESNES